MQNFMKVVKIMKKHIKLIMLLALTSPLPLTCMFHTVKKIGKTACAIPLTFLTVRFANMHSSEKECVARHETGHAIAALEKKRILRCASIKEGSMNRYIGFSQNEIDRDDICINDLIDSIVCAFGGPAKDLEDTNFFERQNFMELELGLPLTRTQRQISDDLEYIHDQMHDQGDLYCAYNRAYEIVNAEIRNDFNFNTKKQIDDRVQVLLLKGLQDAKNIVQQNKLQIDAIAQELYDKEFLSGDQVQAIIKSVSIKN